MVFQVWSEGGDRLIKENETKFEFITTEEEEECRLLYSSNVCGGGGGGGGGRMCLE